MSQFGISSSLPAEGVIVLGLVDDAEVLERLLELVNVREAVDRLVARGVRAVRPPELLRRLGAADSDLGGEIRIFQEDNLNFQCKIWYLGM